MLYIKKWGDNFLFDDEIERDGKKWIEDQITPQFFEKFAKSEFVEVAPLKFKEKKTLVSSIYKNLQEILEMPGT